MAKVIHRDTNPRQKVRLNKKIRIRKKLVSQKNRRVRLVIYRSNKFLYAQLVDDLKGHTIAQANTREKSFEQAESRKNLESAKQLGKLIAQRSLENSIDKVVFDRNGYNFHGRIKAIADGAREAGLKF